MDPRHKGGKKHEIPVRYEANIGRRPNVYLLVKMGTKRPPKSKTAPFPPPVTDLPRTKAKRAPGRGKKGRQARLSRRAWAGAAT